MRSVNSSDCGCCLNITDRDWAFAWFRNYCRLQEEWDTNACGCRRTQSHNAAPWIFTHRSAFTRYGLMSGQMISAWRWHYSDGRLSLLRRPFYGIQPVWQLCEQLLHDLLRSLIEDLDIIVRLPAILADHIADRAQDQQADIVLSSHPCQRGGLPICCDTAL